MCKKSVSYSPILHVRIFKKSDNNVKKRSWQITECFPSVSTRPNFSYSAQQRVLTIDNWNPSCATLATRYNSGVRFQPFLSTPVRFTALYNNVETQRNARKVQLPPYLIYWIIGIKLPHLCARRPSLRLPPPETMAKPALQFPAPMSSVGSCGSLMRRFVRAHKTHLDPSWPSSRHPPPLILSFSLALSPYPLTLLFGSRPQCEGE